ncbi:mechanosensitive ion channel protein 10-like [Cucurbita pepo subsp. pepo]|uniref:mechanosensitive ion channel protein 10-like n=1 Tax=Cucurbita pepo subsp. pepo TaxID=3664 RepID=UPI000C9D810C|nr:mechanosensitive ion channel protein 10-like [Cucurbita pepo subsp. pepo]
MEVRKPENDHLVLAIDPPEKEQISLSPARTKTLRRLNFSKPKSRFDEPNFPLSTPRTIPESTELLQPTAEEDSSSSSSYSEEEDEDEEIGAGNEGRKRKRKKKKKKINKRVLIEWILFLTITTCLICALTLKSLQAKQIWSLEVWKWCLIVMVVFCGRLVSEWLVGLLVFIIERNFMLRERVLYFVYGLRKSFQNCAWLGLVLIAWMIMFPDVHNKNKVLLKVFRFLIAVLVGATIWLLKILLVKVLASSFHVATFFDRMKESVFNHYILETLSGPPLDEAEMDKEENRKRRLQKMSKSLPARLQESGGGQILSRSKRQDSCKKIDMEMLRKLSLQRRPSAWSAKRLMSYVKSSGLSTISRTVDDFANAESEITSESEARNCAQRVFKNVAKPGARSIGEDDLLRFLKVEEVTTIFPLFEGAMETGKISKSAFRNWVVHAYIERKALAHSLNDTKTAVQQLHKLASAVVIVIIIVISLLVLGVATTKVLFVVTSQLLLVGFMFQNTCKTIFESIIFVFVMHPFDVGDRCVIDGVHMFVEEMNILSTVFLRFDNEKIYYPNSVLLTKPISNFRRSPDMSDTVDFTIDVSTSFDNITALRKAMQIYIESKPKHWSPKHSLVVKEIENVDKMKMSLCVQHTMNHQNFPERNNRRSDLILELKRVFELLGIKYHLLPQEVVVTQFNLTNGRMAIPSS